MPLILDKDKREQVEGLDANEAFQEYLCQLKDRFPTNKRITLIHCPTFNFIPSMSRSLATAVIMPTLPRGCNA